MKKKKQNQTTEKCSFHNTECVCCVAARSSHSDLEILNMWSRKFNFPAVCSSWNQTSCSDIPQFRYGGACLWQVRYVVIPHYLQRF